MRHPFRALALTSVVLLGSLLLGDERANAANPSYRIRCRGGDKVTLSYYLNLPTGATSLNATQLLNMFEVRMRFDKSPTAGNQPLPPSSCAWMDRPFNSVETPRFRWQKAPFVAQIALDPSEMKYSTNKLGYITNGASAEKFIEYKDKLGSSSAYFDFWGYWNSGYLYITKVGP